VREADGSEMPIKGVYREIVAPERVVCTEIFEQFEEIGGVPVATMTLKEHDGKAMLTTTVLYDSKEIRDAVIGSGMEYGAAETFDRLAELLETMA